MTWDWVTPLIWGVGACVFTFGAVYALISLALLAWQRTDDNHKATVDNIAVCLWMLAIFVFGAASMWAHVL